MSPSKNGCNNGQDNYKSKYNKNYGESSSLNKDNDKSKHQKPSTKRKKLVDNVSDTSDTDISNSLLNDVSDANEDNKRMTKSNINQMENLMNLYVIQGNVEAKKYIRDALDYAVKSGYLKPEDSTCKLLRVSSNLVNVKDNPQSSAKRVRSSSAESQVDDKINKKSHKKRKRKTTQENNIHRSRSNTEERELRNKNSKKKTFILCQVENNRKNLDSGKDEKDKVKSAKLREKKSLKSCSDSLSDEELHTTK